MTIRLVLSLDQRHALPSRTFPIDMSLARCLPRSLQWTSVPVSLVAVLVFLQHVFPVHAMKLLHSNSIQPLCDISPPSILDWNDAAAFKYDNIIGSQSFNQSSYDIVPWHARTIEYRDLTKVASIQEGRLEIMHHPALGAKPVLVKKAGLPEYIESISRETEFYRLLDGLSVTPLFLGHVAEGGVITGFVAEYVVEQPQQQTKQTFGERPSYRSRGTEACLSALRRMHWRKIAHRDAHSGNCLVRQDGSAVLVDFELAEGNTSEEEFERDLWVMRHSRDAELAP